ncbi:8-oxoguanine DNA glycosylase OGG fold protein [Rhizobium laguerreae]|uniref:8-oxoguanine DNA glycosylase OGG fold protein n=1 Tax=Rhizobium laguerreae TaxID=1076926 RepID=UPI0031BA8EBF
MWHRSEYPGAEVVEQCAKRLIAANFPPNDATAFIGGVCEWGRGNRNFSRIRDAGDTTIAQSLRSATEAIDAGDVTRSIEELQRLPHLGLSFASKVARFLAPDKCVVLDSVIRNRIGYVESEEGYSEFLQDCFQLLQTLRTSPDLEAPLRDRLRVCDVEAAVFIKARDQKNVSP